MRTYLDHNATTPLRAEARAAMLAAMDVVGNPSSVHAEGRAAKGVIEKARAQVAEAVGASNADVVFVSGATEAAALALAGRGFKGGPIEHDAVHAWIDPVLPVVDGAVQVDDPAGSVLQLANSETGIVQELPQGVAVSDITQGFGRLPFAFSWSGVGMVFLSAHKFGGPKGVGALIFLQKLRISPDAAFSVNDWTAFVIFIVVIGGIGTIEGPIIGTLIFFALRETLADLGTIYLLVLGLVAIVVMLKAPKGVWGLIRSRFDLELFPLGYRVRHNSRKGK